MFAETPALGRALIRNVLPASLRSALRRIRGSGRETLSARYCYAVWLRHLVKADENGLPTDALTVAELGPGASLGVGIAALLTGAERYVALDVVRHAGAWSNLSVIDELVELFQERSPIPGSAEFPEIRPRVEPLAFPSVILTDERLGRSLDSARLRAIRERIDLDRLEYVAPWDDPAAVDAESVDLVFSQAVMEHVADLGHTYGAIFQWLKPGGFMSHQIDFRSHGTSQSWNGHWVYPDAVWRFVRGDAPINRQPISRHLEAIETAGFRLVACETEHAESRLRRQSLPRQWRWLDDHDLSCAGAFVQAIRPDRIP